MRLAVIVTVSGGIDTVFEPFQHIFLSYMALEERYLCQDGALEEEFSAAGDNALSMWPPLDHHDFFDKNITCDDCKEDHNYLKLLYQKIDCE